MNFRHDGNLYRIVFHHDPSNELGAHIGHTITILPVYGKLRLCCLGCDPSGVPLPLWPINKKDTRNTTCLIQAQRSELKMSGIRLHWETVLVGRSRLNVKAGDVFTKADGRKAALENATCGTSLYGVAKEAYDRR